MLLEGSGPFNPFLAVLSDFIGFWPSVSSAAGILALLDDPEPELKVCSAKEALL